MLEVLRSLGQAQATLELEGEIVRPEQFYGIEVNPRAAAIAELVLWIGYLQWHLRTRGDAAGLPEPILRNLHNIECRDAVLAWDAVEPLLDAEGRPVTRWDGRTTKTHPVTGEPVPDETARVPAWRYVNPRPAAWPEADFIVGQPAVHRHGAHARGAGRRLRRGAPPRLSPRAGLGRLRDVLVGQGGRAGADGPGAALRLDHHQQPAPDLQPPRARTPPRGRPAAPAGQVQDLLLHLAFAIPDHPWVDSAEGAAVRIAMTVGAAGEGPGVLQQVVSERPGDDGTAEVTLAQKSGQILPDLTIGADVARRAAAASQRAT